jgi:hypothetical protein
LEPSKGKGPSRCFTLRICRKACVLGADHRARLSNIMASAVADLEAGLQAMLNLKPPGVSGSRITSLTSLCVANIQSESVLIQKIYTHFKKAPGTHKLGVLYVVDSVTRKWLEQAKTQGQAINGSAQDGTYAAGVHRVTELMPVLMGSINIPPSFRASISQGGIPSLASSVSSPSLVCSVFELLSCTQSDFSLGAVLLLSPAFVSTALPCL